jgi:3-phosphoshikimate 1-carboxyvinyltransferase
MVRALAALGARVHRADDAWQVEPGSISAPADIDVGLAGTVMRFVPPVAALATGPVHFDGDPRSRERPLAPLIDALRELGVTVDDGGRGGLPMTVIGSGSVRGGVVSMDASSSSQLLSALLLAAARYDDGVAVTHSGDRQPSAPFIDLTVDMLRDRGVTVNASGGTWTVKPGPVAGGDVDIEPDLSSAAPFLLAPLVAGGSVRVLGWPRDSRQAGAATPALLRTLGATVDVDVAGIVVSGGGVVPGFEADLADNPELACALAAVAALANEPAQLSGIAHLRGHETDRLAALARELSALGANVRELPDGLAFTPAALHGGTFHTYDDHRLVMAAALLGLVVPDVVIENPATVGKTFPSFAQEWSSMVAGDAS